MNNTERDIIYAVYKYRKELCTSYDICIPNCYTQHDNEADMFFLRKSGLCDEIEIKISRSDLLVDKKKIVTYREFNYPEDCLAQNGNPHKKPKYDALECGELSCNYFWYAIKEGIGGEEDIPPFAGLLLVKDDGTITLLRKPKRLHKNKMSFEDRYKIARKASYRYWRTEFNLGL